MRRTRLHTRSGALLLGGDTVLSNLDTTWDILSVFLTGSGGATNASVSQPFSITALEYDALLMRVSYTVPALPSPLAASDVHFTSPTQIKVSCP